MQRFFALIHDKRLGPFTLEELRRLCAEGMLDVSTAVEDERTGAAKTLGELLPQCAPEDRTSSTAPAPGPGQGRPVSLPVDKPAVHDYWGTAWTLILAVLSLYFLIKRPAWCFLDYVNLIFHEAGHLILSFLGTFVHFLGGTLLQLAVPLGIALVFIREGKAKSAQFCFFWLGESCLNVSVYAADARAQRLPLVGGGEHDWAYLLSRMGLLEHDTAVAAFFVLLAAVAFVLACFWPALAGMRADAAAREAAYESSH